MNSEVAWVLVPSGTQVEPQITLDLDYLPDYLSVSHGYTNIFQGRLKKLKTVHVIVQKMVRAGKFQTKKRMTTSSKLESIFLISTYNFPPKH